MKYYGDFYLGSTLDFKFTTIDAGIPTSVSGSTIAAYANNSTTEIFGGITLTPDFDSLVGLNHVRVVMSSGNGYVADSNYDLVMVSGTVGGKSAVGYVVGSFSVQARPALIVTGTITNVLNVVNPVGLVTGTYISNLANLDVAVSTRLASASYTTPPTAIENADALLKRDWNSVTGEAARSVLNALRKLRNKVSFSAGTLSIKKEDDATDAYTQSVTQDGNQTPFKEVG